MKILIVRVSAIGDVIHTLPAIFYLKHALPRAKISWVVQEKAASLLKNQPYIDNLYILPDKFLHAKNLKSTKNLITKLRKTSWDVIIDFQGLLKTSIIYAMLSGKKFGFDKNHTREKLSAWFTHHKTNPNYKNIIQKNLALVSTVISTLEPKQKSCPSIDFLKKDFSYTVRKPCNFTKSRLHAIALAPNTTWPSKHWPIENWKKLIDKLVSCKYEIILLGKDFGDQAEELSKYVTENNLPVMLAPKWNLETTADFIKKIDLLIAPDTGLLHLADFLGTLSIGLFCPTLASSHGPFLHKKNIVSAIQVHGDCFEKLPPGQLFESISQLLIK
jgi:lipopolysaccharide heptosyltransferase I